MTKRRSRTRTVGTLVVVSSVALIAWTGRSALHAASHDGRRPSLDDRPSWTADSAVSRGVRGQLQSGLDALDNSLAELDRNAASTDARRVAFRHARSAYKRLEGLIAFYSPTTVTALNGTEAAEGDDDPDAGSVVPHGFQRIEGDVFGASDATSMQQSVQHVRDEVARMRLFITRFRPTVPYVATSNAGVIDVVRLELARVSTLGIAGVDVTDSGDAMREAAAAIDGARALLATTTLPIASVDAPLAAAATALRAHPDDDTFDRFAFITDRMQPAFAALATLAGTTPDSTRRWVWPRHVASVYDPRSLDVMAFADAGTPRPTVAWTTLGRRLFGDPTLSGDGQRSCASCHVPARGFTDGLPRARPALGSLDGSTRHTPSLLYAAWQPAQFADARAATLEAQVDSVLASRTEMRSSTALVVERLRTRAEYRTLFAAASGSAPGVAVTPRNVRVALAAYVRSLGHFDSRFDRAMRGDAAVLSDAERRGFNLFMGRARCGTCHFAPLFNGTAPPDFVRSDVEVIGVPRRFTVRHASIDTDSGRAAIDRLAGHLHAFRTPTVRTAALGGPYMHNGALRTLDDVIDFYDRGGGVGLGADVPNQTLVDRPLHLTRRDRQDLVAFLHALADTTDTPLRRPTP